MEILIFVGMFVLGMLAYAVWWFVMDWRSQQGGFTEEDEWFWEMWQTGIRNAGWSPIPLPGEKRAGIEAMREAERLSKYLEEKDGEPH